MHYYRKNIGDYNKRAGRLSLLQNGVYERLRDACLEREQFPTRKEAIEWTWASTKAEKEAVDFILERFFEIDNEGKFVDPVVFEMLHVYQEFCVKQGERGKHGGRPKGSNKKPGGLKNKPSGNPEGFLENPAETQRKPNKPLTTNHYPLTTTEDRTVEPVLNPDYIKDMRLVTRIWEGVQRVAPKQKKPELESWADTVRLMRERDGLSRDEIWAVFKYANHHTGEKFSWSTNILSVKTLREKFGKLDAEMRRHSHGEDRGYSGQGREATVTRASRIAAEQHRRIQAEIDALEASNGSALESDE